MAKKEDKKVEAAPVDEQDLSKGIPAGASQTNKLSVAMKAASKDKEWLAKWFDDAMGVMANLDKGTPDGAHAKNVASVKQGGVKEAVREATKEDLQAIFGETELSDEVKEQMAALLEAAVDARVAGAEIAIREEAEAKIAEAVEAATADLSKKFDDFTTFVGEKWLETNAVALKETIVIDSALKFVEALRGLFLEHAIDIPADKVDVVEVQQKKIAELEESLNGSLKENMELKAEKKLARKGELVKAATEGLTLTQAEALTKLAEGLEYDGDEKAFTDRLDFAKAQSKKAVSDTGIVTEGTEGTVPTETKKSVDAGMQRVLAAASKLHNR